MQRFFSQVVATVLGFLIAFILFMGFVIGIVVLSTKPSPPKLYEQTILHIALRGKVVEHTPRAPLQALQSGQKDLIDLIVLKEALKRAQEDVRISGIYLEVGALVAGWASLAEIREALQACKDAGKFMIAYGEHYTQKTFYVASLADEVVLHPAGTFLFNGLSLSVLFYKGLLDKLGIVPQVFRVGQYKSGGEPLVSHAMSEASKHQGQVLLTTLYDHLIAKIATARGLSPASLRKMAHTLAVTLPQEAHKARLITQVGHFNDAEAWIRTQLGLAEETPINYVGFHKYQAAHQASQSSPAQVAVLVVAGTMTDNPEVPHSINTKAFIKDLKQLRQDPAVKAIVLRINSPGGSALAADTMWKELMLTRAHKPIVASMADVAASGGYYLAVACHHIIAHPTTLTGSIGIFGLHLSIDTLLKNKLGITIDGVKTAPSADLFSSSRPLSAHEKAVIQRWIDQGYATFLARVATGRQMSQTATARVAAGRVWPGSLAQKHGLVDELGSLENAIEKAAALADLVGAYTVSYWPKPKTWLEEALSGWREIQNTMLRQHTGEAMVPYLKTIQELIDMRGIQARLPYVIEID